MKRETYALWLDSAPGIGKKYRRLLLDYAGEEGDVYRLKEEELALLLPPRQQNLFTDWRKRRFPEELQQYLDRHGIRFVPWFTPDYPKRLREIPDAPYGIYVRGRLPEQGRGAAAIIGARACSEYGRKMARWFAGELAAAGIQIVSGLARGIDGISQQAALEAGGASFGVLGCGVDICYPPENRNLFERCIGQGGILSEYPPGTGPRAGLFPERNRIISGLCDALIVVEAREQSGTLITVDMALEQGREVFAVPGRATDPLSLGCNRLIRQGAAMAADPGDVIAYLEECACRLRTEEIRTSGNTKDVNEVRENGRKRIVAQNAEPGWEQEEEQGGTGSERIKTAWLEPEEKRRRMLELLDENPQSFSELHQAFCRQAGMEETGEAETAGVLADLVLDGAAYEKGRGYYYRR